MHAYSLSPSNDFLRLAEATHDDWRALHTRLQILGKRRGAADAEEARCLREAEHLRIWRKVGEPSMLAYIERVLGYGPRCAYDRMRVASALGELPVMERALADGHVFYSVVRELTRVATWETEAAWVAAVAGKSLREVEELVSGREKGDLPGAPPTPEKVRHVIQLEVSAETYALFRQARSALKEELGEHLDDDRFLALMARRALQPAGSGARHQIAVTKCEACKRAFQDGGGTVVEIAAVALETAECTGEHIDSDGVITRHVPEATRRAVRRRDHGRCRVPWCRSTGDLHEHHIEHFAHGGNHAKGNLITLCWSHHRDLHDGKLRLTVEGSEVRFARFSEPANDTSIFEQAVSALVNMGFRKSEAASFVERAIAHVGKDVKLNELLRESLRCVPPRR